MYSLLCPHPLGHSGVGHSPLLFVTAPVVIFLEDSIAAHFCLVLGAVFVVS